MRLQIRPSGAAAAVSPRALRTIGAGLEVAGLGACLDRAGGRVPGDDGRGRRGVPESVPVPTCPHARWGI